MSHDGSSPARSLSLLVTIMPKEEENLGLRVTLFSVWSLGSTTDEAENSFSTSDKQLFLISHLLLCVPSQAGIKLPQPQVEMDKEF